MQIPDTLSALTVPIDTLVPYPRNPRRGDTAAIADSLKAHGQYRPLVVRTGTNEVLAGNHTLAAARSLSWPSIAVTYITCDDDEAARIVLVDNRSNDLAGYSDEDLVALLTDLPDLTGTGYTQEALDALVASTAQPPALLGDPDDVPDLPQDEPITKRGDLITLGRHRLLCGDSTLLADVERVMDGALADLVWTDPPYGVNHAGGTKDPRDTKNYRSGHTLDNDTIDPAQLETFLRETFTNAWACCRPGAAWYVASPANGRAYYAFATPLLELDVWRHSLVWVKQAFVFGRSDYHYRHESIFYGWKDGAAHYFTDDHTQDTVWEIDRQAPDKALPIHKPVELVARAIRNSSLPNALVLDSFGGSGTTLIAAEQEGRQARLIELDPAFCDVIVTRWARLTGQKAQRPTDARVTAGA